MRDITLTFIILVRTSGDSSSTGLMNKMAALLMMISTPPKSFVSLVLRVSMSLNWDTST